MRLFQVIAIGYLAGRIRTMFQVALGFGLMGTGIILILVAPSLPFLLGVVSLLALGMALISPNLTALVSEQGGQHKGAVLGLQNAANSLGQVGGPILGGILFAWQASIPYLFAGTFLAGVGIWIGLTKKGKQRSFN